MAPVGYVHEAEAQGQQMVAQAFFRGKSRERNDDAMRNEKDGISSSLIPT